MKNGNMQYRDYSPILIFNPIAGKML